MWAIINLIRVAGVQKADLTGGTLQMKCTPTFGDQAMAKKSFSKNVNLDPVMTKKVTGMRTPSPASEQLPITSGEKSSPGQAARENASHYLAVLRAAGCVENACQHSKTCRTHAE